jgi:hypothetical protein
MQAPQTRCQIVSITPIRTTIDIFGFTRCCATDILFFLAMRAEGASNLLAGEWQGLYFLGPCIVLFDRPYLQ